jgi:hypothetical protein
MQRPAARIVLKEEDFIFKILDLRGKGYCLWVMGYELWVMGYGLWVMGYGLWVMGYGLWVMGYGVKIECIKLRIQNHSHTPILPYFLKVYQAIQQPFPFQESDIPACHY